MTFMGAGEVDADGNVNVSRLANRVIGCGGFIDITQSARRICFLFQVDGRHPKFVKHVDHLTFSADMARAAGQEVLYVTERGVFELVGSGLRLIEVAPGTDMNKQLLDLLPFHVDVAEDLQLMPSDIFRASIEPVSLKGKAVRRSQG
jgi:propionate CoA-transferase